MHVVYSTLKFGHHGSRSGYDLLSDYTCWNKTIVPKTSLALQSKIRGITRINRLLERVSMQLLQRRMQRSIRSDTRVVHFLYPENTYFKGDFLLSNQVKIVGTLHQPTDWYERQPPKIRHRLLNLDAAIVLTPGMVEEVQERLGLSHVVYIPHGVDLQYFQPGDQERDKKHVLMLGNWQRDFEYAKNVFSVLTSADPAVRVTVVCNQEYHSWFKGISKVVCRSGISDTELLNYLQTVTLLYLPLKAATANNALLEAAACGLPILVNDIDGMFDYFNRGELYVDEKQDPNKTTNQILSLLGSSNTNLKKSNALIYSSNSYDWKLVATETERLYEQISMLK
jgi:glycosyltransferase involved in cell wall biosynthesis